jgi:hypothetical protein
MGDHRRVLTACLVAAVTGATLLAGGAPAGAVPLNRPADPVVLTGAQLPTLVNGSKTTIVGFRWTGGAWAQLPVQVDERAVVNFGKIYNNPTASFYGSTPGNTSALVYTSPNTFTGGDPNPRFDSDDEIAFMARDAGEAAPTASRPTGTVVGSGVQIRVTDPVSAGSEGYVYLFREATGSGLKQNAGVTYVKYQFKLLSGSYKTSYKLGTGPNPENTLITGATYKHHFSDRWLSDQLSITAPGASGVDILDRHKALFAPGTCVRSEDTFDQPTVYGSSEGAFVTNKTGPIRAIRSYLGANSGPNTQRTHLFYDRREDVVTDLRVHSIGSIMDFLDYSAAATGMTYRSDVAPGGVTIDGSPDTVTTAAPTWEQVAGAPGTLTNVGSVQTNYPLVGAQGYYEDNTTPVTTQCTGDSSAYGASGLFLNGTIPNTDPATGGTATLKGTRVMFFDPPGGTATTAAAHQAEVAAPLVTTVTAGP